jgi:GNAT superfamily N-acetyltransferase
MTTGMTTGMTSAYPVVALTAETWPAFEALAARHHGIFNGCWCTSFHTLEADKDPDRTSESNRLLKRQLVEQGRAHAALVMDGDEAVAWCEYGPPSELPNIQHRKQYDATSTREADYRLTCVFVDRRYRRQGLTEVAITGALDLIAEAGGGVVEGYPHDLTNQTKKMSSSFLYNATRSVYERLGFTYDRPKGLKNCVMVKVVQPVGTSAG